MKTAKRITFTEQQDNLIRLAYSSDRYGSKDYGVAKIAQKMGISAGTMFRRASELGVVRRGHKPHRHWSPEEEHIVEANAHKELEAINRALIKAGYESRSYHSIKGKLRSLGVFFREVRLDNGVYNQNQLAELMGIHTRVINRYIKDGHLKAKQRDGITQIEYFILARDVRDFIKNCTPMVDIAKCDKYWLIDILTGAIK